MSTEPRETNMDGELHVEGECCEPGRSILGRWCRDCGARVHCQPVYGGIAETCEACPRHARHWETRGTYRTAEMADGVGVAGSSVVRATGLCL